MSSKERRGTAEISSSENWLVKVFKNVVIDTGTFVELKGSLLRLL